MATHSSILALKIPWMEESVRLQSLESQRVRHNWAISLSFFSLDCNEIKLVHAEENQPEYSLDWCWSWSSNTLVWRANSLEKALTLGEVGNRGWDGWMASPTRWAWVWASSREDGGQRSVACCRLWGRKELDAVWMTEQQQSEFAWGPPERKLGQGPSFPNCPSLQRGGKVGSYFTSYTWLLQSLKAFSKNFRSRELV